MAVGHEWKTRLASYLREPGQAWERPDERQVVKLRSVFNRARQEYDLDSESLIEGVINAVENRDPVEQRPIYLSNLGGCGSHWISRMMAQAGRLVDVGEVYLPVSWYGSMLDFPRDLAARVLDGIELVHGILYNGMPGDFVKARIINSAHGYEKIAFHRALRPGASVIHLIRDPRDRTMSVSFRKDEFRYYEAAGVEDREYFMSKAMRSLSAWRKYDGLERKADVEIRYEAFRSNPAEQLWMVLDQLGLAPTRALASSVAYRNSPEYLRSGRGRKADIGNLDQGGIAKSWRELPPDLQRALHSTVAPVLIGQGYALCDCFPEDGRDGLNDNAGLQTALSSLNLEGVLVDFRHRNEKLWAGIAGVDYARVDRVRLRVSSRTIPIKVINSLRQWITDVCAAGIRNFNNDALARLGRLPAVICMDLARTSVASLPDRAAFPGLEVINLSGTPAIQDAGRFEGVAVISDY